MVGRNKKRKVDYFPHEVNHGKTMTILEKKYGNDGYAFWFKLLEKLGDTEGHCLDLSREEERIYLSSETNLDEEKCFEILDLLARVDAIDKQLWDQERKVWSQNFVDGVRDVYRKRSSACPENPRFRHENGISDTKMPQSKVKESKEKKSTSGSEDSDPTTRDELEKEFGEKPVQFADHMISRVKEINERANPPSPGTSTYRKWVQAFDRLNRIGPCGGDKGYEWDELAEILKWAFNDDFWSGNVASPIQLRRSGKNGLAKIVNIENSMDKKGKTDFEKKWEAAGS